MRLTGEKLSHLAHQVLEALVDEGLVTIAGRADALTALKDALEKQAARSDAIDTLIREKLRKQRKIPGSREWQILYDKYFQEEKGKLGW